MPSTETPSLTVRDANGSEMFRVPFGAARLIVGRSPQAAVRLDHSMVSRQHSEIWRDSDGRVHVRDLKSRNGTLVNGVAIIEHILADGDQITVGPFVLCIPGAARKQSSMASTRIVLSDGIEGRISTLKDHAPPRIDVAHLTTLNEFSKQLLDTPDPADRATLLCRLMVGPQFRGQWGVIVRSGRGAVEEPPEVLCEAHGAMGGREPYLSRGVLRKVRDSGDAVLATNSGLPALQEGDVQISIAVNLVAMAAVACPIVTSEESIDFLYVMLPPMLGSAEWLALVNLAVKQYQQAESAWAARKQAQTMAVMERELARARQIQMRLVPRDPKFDGLEVAIGFVPCHWVGGDYVDAVKMADGRTFLAIADVCGKGLPAALVASSVHTMIHAGVLSGLGLPQIMSNLNSYLVQTLAEESFVTMIAIAVDAASGQVELVNAGHPPPLLISSGHAPLPIEVESNFPLGLQTESMVSHQLTLEAGGLLALYSDGLSELSDDSGQMLGIGGLSSELESACAATPTGARAAAEFLSRRLDALQGSRPSADDRTFLLARRI